MKGGLLRRLPIREKLVAMIMITTAAVLVLASAGYLASDYYRLRQDLASELGATAHLVLENSSAAINFDDEQAARDTLATLATVPRLRMACLYDARGALFTSWVYRGTIADCPREAAGGSTALVGERDRPTSPPAFSTGSASAASTSAATPACWPLDSGCKPW